MTTQPPIIEELVKLWRDLADSLNHEASFDALYGACALIELLVKERDQTIKHQIRLLKSLEATK